MGKIEKNILIPSESNKFSISDTNPVHSYDEKRPAITSIAKKGKFV